MKKSILYRYKVDNVPFYFQPAFYFCSYSVALLLYVYILIVHFTSTVHIEGQEHMHNRQNYIFCHWHAFVPLFASVFIRIQSQAWMQHPFWYMKSIHIVLRLMGVKKIILGSTGHDGRQAADDLVEYLKKGYSTILLPDGPGGPARVAKKGMLHISLKSHVPIVPMQFSSSKFIEMTGWDKKKLPLPFSTINVQFGKPIQVSEANVDKAYAEITKALG